ncbi:hypothetical protein BG19_5941 [Burkholderia pseudomallei MSHR840]|nr:hypothetical protein BG19_5941 [Burkholderia pseudomallei MSHR840]
MPPEAIAARWSAAAAARRAHRSAHRAARSGRHRRRIGVESASTSTSNRRPDIGIGARPISAGSASTSPPRIRSASVPHPIRTRAASPTSAAAPRITRGGCAKCAGERRAFRVNRAESATSPTTGASRSRATGRPPQSDRSAARHADAPPPPNGGERPARQRAATDAASAIRAFSSGLPATKYFFAHRESGCSARPPCAPAFPAVEPPPSPRREAIASARAR